MQVGNANGIVFGSTFLRCETTEENEFLEYSYIITDNELTEQNYSMFDNNSFSKVSNNYNTINKVKLAYSNGALTMEFYKTYSGTLNNGSEISKSLEMQMSYTRILQL